MVRCVAPDIKTSEVIQRDCEETFPLKKHFGRSLSDAAKLNSNALFIKVLRNLRDNCEKADLVELILHGMKTS